MKKLLNNLGIFLIYLGGLCILSILVYLQIYLLFSDMPTIFKLLLSGVYLFLLGVGLVNIK